MLQTIYILAIAAAAAYLALCLLLYILQAGLIYFPSSEIEACPADIGLQFEDVFLEAADGTRISAWHVPSPDAQFTILMCHGNGGNISHRLEIIKLLHAITLNVFIFDYRGYGRSGGRPSEHGTYLDAEAAYRWLLHQKKIPENRIIVSGHSLGGAIAANLAAKTSPAACVIEAAFTSIPEMARRHYPVFPTALLCRFKYDTLAAVKNIRCPVLVICSREDEIVPFEHGIRIFNAARDPKKLVELRGSHNSMIFESEDDYAAALRSIIKHLP